MHSLINLLVSATGQRGHHPGLAYDVAHTQRVWKGSIGCPLPATIRRPTNRPRSPCLNQKQTIHPFPLAFYYYYSSSKHPTATMPLVVPGLMNSKSKTEEWQHQLLGKKLSESTSEMVCAVGFFFLPWTQMSLESWVISFESDACRKKVEGHWSCFFWTVHFASDSKLVIFCTRVLPLSLLSLSPQAADIASFFFGRLLQRKTSPRSTVSSARAT